MTAVCWSGAHDDDASRALVATRQSTDARIPPGFLVARRERGECRQRAIAEEQRAIRGRSQVSQPIRSTFHPPPLRMSRHDVRQYLEKIYLLPVRDVRIQVPYLLQYIRMMFR